MSVLAKVVRVVAVYPGGRPPRDRSLVTPRSVKQGVLRGQQLDELHDPAGLLDPAALEQALPSVLLDGVFYGPAAARIVREAKP